MDPDILLKELLAIAKQVLRHEDRYEDTSIEMAEKIINLDNWLKNGGFLPHKWAGGGK